MRDLLLRLCFGELPIIYNELPTLVKSLFSLLAVGLLVGGCATHGSKVSRTPVKANAHFTLAYVDDSQVDVPVTATKFPLLRNAGGGYATVQYIVDAKGRPREAQWVEASSLAFGNRAVAVIEQARFKPASKAGVTVAVKMETRVTSHEEERVGFRSGDENFEPTHYAEQSSNFPRDINPFTGH